MNFQRGCGHHGGVKCGLKAGNSVTLEMVYSSDSVRLAGANPKGGWRTKAARRSPRYTTKLSEVLRLH